MRCPSRPEPFGYKLTWLAVKYADPFELLHAVNDRQYKVLPASWSKGLDNVYKEVSTFITPTIGAWTFVVDPPIGELSDGNTLAFLQKLSTTFSEVQYYANHRVSSYAAWGKFVNGKVIRAYSSCNGETLISRGQLTQAEEHLIAKAIRAAEEYGLEISLVEDWSDCLDDEDDVMEMAGQWSINPQTLDQYPETYELGLLIVRR